MHINTYTRAIFFSCMISIFPQAQNTRNTNTRNTNTRNTTTDTRNTNTNTRNNTANTRNTTANTRNTTANTRNTNTRNTTRNTNTRNTTDTTLQKNPSEIADNTNPPTNKAQTKPGEQITEIKLTGKVKNEAGDNLVGASILVKGKDIGVVSDATGQFTIAVKSNDTLVVTSLGMEDMIVPVRKQKRLYVNMLPKLGDLSGVNTILGAREAISVGFDYQQNVVDYVQNEYDFVDGLPGKVEGMDIVRSSGVIGSAYRFKFRGVGSTLNNEPLIIVDGTPMSYSVFGATDGVDLSSRLFDINPNDIAMITFLKSAAALSLYGVRGGNGAVLITTKRGRNGSIQIAYGSNVRLDFARNLPEKQKNFGFSNKSDHPNVGGNPNNPFNAPIFNGPNSWQNGGQNILTGGANNYETIMGSPEASDALFNAYSQNDQLKDIYNNFGLSQNHQVSLFGGKGRFKTFSSLSFTRGESELAAVPNTGFTRFTFRFNGASELTDNISVDFSSVLSSLRAKKIRKGYLGHSYSSYLLPSNFDVKDDVLYDLFYNGNQINGTIWSGATGYDLPQYISNDILFFESANHFTASARFTYNFTKPNQDPLKREEMILVHRLGTDYSALKTQHKVDGNSRSNGYILGVINPGLAGIIYDEQLRINSDLYFSFSKNFSNKHSVKAIAGISYSGLDATTFSSLNAQQSAGSSTNYGFSTVGDLPYQQNNLGLLLRSDYAFRKIFFANIYLRHDINLDWYPLGGYGNNALAGQIYPGLDVSFIFTQLSKQGGKKGFGSLSFGRIRASAGIVGNAPTAENFAYYSANFSNPLDYNPDTFQILASSVNSQDNFQVMATNGSMYPYKNQELIYPTDIRPETKYGFDGGFDLGFLDDRFMIKGTFFYEMLRGGFLMRRSDEDDTKTELRNMVDVNSMGTDFGMDFKMISNQYLDWTLGANILWTTNQVVKVADGNIYAIADVQGVPGIANVVMEGQPYGAIYGTTWNLNGEQFWGSSTATQEQAILGNPLPLMTLGLSNQFNFYGVNLSFVFQAKIGGDMWNGTKQYMDMNGSGIDTGNRDEEGAVPVDPGLAPVTPTGWNDASLDYWRVYGTASETGIQKNVHFIKLKDVTLAYSMNIKNPKSLVKSYQVYAKGKDLWMWTNYLGGTDPDIASGSSYRTYGLDFFPNPLTRAVIVGFKLTF